MTARLGLVALGIVAALGLAEGLLRIPAFVAENGAAGREPLYKRNDNHWTPRGNRLAAGALVAFLAPLVCAR